MTASAEGRSLELYFIDGKPDGMLTAEVFNWTGHVLMTPRTRIGAALKRPEARYTGVYILLGELEGEPRAYIGEGEDISERIKNHDTNKDWWTSAVLITASSRSLNKAYAKYLEARLVEIARSVGRMKLDNGNTPPRPGLSEAAQANMEAFLNYVMMILPAIQVNLFTSHTRPAAEMPAVTTGTGAFRFRLVNKKNKLEATAILKNVEFIVEAGSLARLQWEGQGVRHDTYADLHAELKKTGVLREDGDHCVFTENYAFSSPSAAAAVVCGRTANGTLDWKLEDGTTYKQWEQTQLSANGEPTA